MVIKYSKDKCRLYFLYTVFGTLTAAVDILTYALCVTKANMSLVSSNIVAWVLSTLVAYITNRKWVFCSENEAPSLIFREILSFFGCRWLTLVMGTAIIAYGVHALNQGEIIMKFISAVFVIIINYVASRIIIFRKRT